MYFLTFILGTIFGSFANCVADRLFTEEDGDVRNVNRYRSYCKSCLVSLKPLDLIPIISYILLSGRCRKCSAKIPIEHFISELLLGILFVAIVFQFGISMKAALFALITSLLMVQALLDIRVMMVSDLITLIIFALSFALSRVLEIQFVSFIIYSILPMFLLFILSEILNFILHKNTLGFGDLKLIFGISGLLQEELLVVFIGLSGLCGLVSGLLVNYKNRNVNVFPFVPSLSIAFFLAFYFKNLTL